MKTLFENVRILKMNGQDIFSGELVVTDNRISYIGNHAPREDKYDRIIEGNGNLLMPTFKNAHAHSAMVFLRSYADDMSLQDWLFKHCIPLEQLLTPNDVYELSKLAFLEYLTSGIGACFDQYYFPFSIAKAAKEIGMRTTILATYTASLSKEDLKKMYEDFNSDKESLVRYCFGIHAEYTVSEAELNVMNELVHECKVPFFTHLSETKKEVDECYQRRGVSPVKFLIDKGVFDYGGGAYHCVWMSDDDLKLFKEKNLTIVTNPGSNSKLASGVADIEKIRKYGINLAIGTDGPASNNCLDMFKEMMLVTNLSKLKYMDPSVTPAEEVLKMATVGGAKAMNLNEADTLEIGKLADIIMIDLHRPNMQPLNNIIKNIVYAGSKDNIKMTMIDGKILYENGQFFVGEDIEDIYRKCQEITDRIKKQGNK